MAWIRILVVLLSCLVVGAAWARPDTCYTLVTDAACNHLTQMIQCMPCEGAPQDRCCPHFDMIDQVFAVTCCSPDGYFNPNIQCMEWPDRCAYRPPICNSPVCHLAPYEYADAHTCDPTTEENCFGS